jgi:hypothetical protein
MDEIRVFIKRIISVPCGRLNDASITANYFYPTARYGCRAEIFQID